MTSPAAALGKLSAKKRFKGKSKKQISEAMRAIAQRPRPSRRKIDKTAIPKRSAKLLASVR